MRNTLFVTCFSLALVGCAAGKPAPYVIKSDDSGSYASSTTRVEARRLSDDKAGGFEPVYKKTAIKTYGYNTQSNSNVEYIDGGEYRDSEVSQVPLINNNYVASDREVIDFSRKSVEEREKPVDRIVVQPKPVAGYTQLSHPVLENETLATPNNITESNAGDDAYRLIKNPPAGKILSAPARPIMRDGDAESAAIAKESKLAKVRPMVKPSLHERAKQEVEELGGIKAKPVEKKEEAKISETPAEAVVEAHEAAAPAAEPTKPVEEISVPEKPIAETKAEIKTEPKAAVEAPTEEVVKVPAEKIVDEPKPEPVAQIVVPESKPKAEEKQPAGAQFLRPVQGEVISKFGNAADGTFNDGIKIKADKGTEVKAAADGEVVYSGNQLQGYGNMIIIKHPNGYLTAYAHLENLDIKKGTKVTQGQAIGAVGDTGNVDEPMLHFGVREGREPIDPEKFLK